MLWAGPEGAGRSSDPIGFSKLCKLPLGHRVWEQGRVPIPQGPRAGVLARSPGAEAWASLGLGRQPPGLGISECGGGGAEGRAAGDMTNNRVIPFPPCPSSHPSCPALSHRSQD